MGGRAHSQDKRPHPGRCWLRLWRALRLLGTRGTKTKDSRTTAASVGTLEYDHTWTTACLSVCSLCPRRTPTVDGREARC